MIDLILGLHPELEWIGKAGVGAYHCGQLLHVVQTHPERDGGEHRGQRAQTLPQHSHVLRPQLC